MKTKIKKTVVAHDLLGLLTGTGSFLDRAEVKLFTAFTNDELLNIHKKEHADLIITSLEMPGIKTEKLFTSLRQDEKLRTVSTILVSTDTLNHRERCKQCKANAVFSRPVDTALLYLKAQQFLNVTPRKVYRATLALAIQGTFKDRPKPFWTENISSQGMLIRSEEELEQGEGIFFSFFLPDGTHVSGYGEISRIDMVKNAAGLFFYGIRFTNIQQADQAAIDAFLGK